MTKRIVEISKFIDANSSVVDIGTDHAMLPIYLYDNNISNDVLATDVNDGPLDIAKKNIGNRKIKLKKTSGLNGIDEEYDIYIIAGMGGHLISNIISDNIVKFRLAKKIILQPMQNIYELRKFLYENNFIILNEHICYENNRFFVIIVVESGIEEIYDFNLFKTNPTGCFEQYCTFLIDKNIKLYEKLPVYNEKRKEIKKIINKLKELN